MTMSILSRPWNTARSHHYALYASPMDPCPTIGDVRAMQFVMENMRCDGIIVAVAEEYRQKDPPILCYNTLSDRVELARALRHVVDVTTYRTEDELFQVLRDKSPTFQILRPSDAHLFQGTPLGIQPIYAEELEATNYRHDLLERIQRGQH